MTTTTKPTQSAGVAELARAGSPRAGRPTFGHNKNLQPAPIPPTKLFLRKQLPERDIHFCDTHLQRKINSGDFPAPVFISERKRMWTHAVLEAFKMVAIAGFAWRDFAVTLRPASEAQQWIEEQLAKKIKPSRKAAR